MNVLVYMAMPDEDIGLRGKFLAKILVYLAMPHEDISLLGIA